jgi:hypothetical protein
MERINQIEKKSNLKNLVGALTKVVFHGLRSRVLQPENTNIKVKPRTQADLMQLSRCHFGPSTPDQIEDDRAYAPSNTKFTCSNTQREKRASLDAHFIFNKLTVKTVCFQNTYR